MNLEIPVEALSVLTSIAIMVLGIVSIFVTQYLDKNRKNSLGDYEISPIESLLRFIVVHITSEKLEARASILLPDKNRNYLRVKFSSGNFTSLEKQLTYIKFQGVPGLAWGNGVPFFADFSKTTVEDLHKRWHLTTDQIDAISPIKSMLALPIFSDFDKSKNVIGVLIIDSPIEEAYYAFRKPETIERITAISRIIGQLLSS